MSTLHSIVNKFFDNSTPILYRQFQPEDLEKLPAISPLNWRSCSSKYRCRLLIGQDRVAKKPVHKAFYGPTEEAVRQRVVDYIRNELEGRTLFHAEQRLVSFQFEKWLRAEKLGRVRPRTYDRLEGTYRNQIKPYVEGIELRELNRSDCQRILRCNLEKGYAASTIRKTAILLKEFLQAKADEDPTFRNPMNGVKLFKDEYVEQWQASLRRTRDALRERQAAGQHLTEAETALANSTLQLESNREVRILTREEADRIKQIAREGCVRSWTSRNGKEVRSAPKPLQQTEFFLFMLNTGLRSGEARALRYSDVDFTNHRLKKPRHRDEAGRGGKPAGRLRMRGRQAQDQGIEPHPLPQPGCRGVSEGPAGPGEEGLRRIHRQRQGQGPQRQQSAPALRPAAGERGHRALRPPRPAPQLRHLLLRVHRRQSGAGGRLSGPHQPESDGAGLREPAGLSEAAADPGL